MPRAALMVGSVVVVLGPLLLSVAASRRRQHILEPLQPSGAVPVEEESRFVPPPGTATASSEGGPSAARGLEVNASAAAAVPPLLTLPSEAIGRARAPRLSATLWTPSEAEAPWYFAGATGGTKRAREQLQMRRNSGYMARDSAPPPARRGGPPVLTGTSWHWGRAGCGRHGCSGRGVCVPRLGRCDCGPYAWGADCSIPVVTQKICVYNDSRPWFCDKPACIHSTQDRVSAAPGEPSVGCVGTPLSQCAAKCHGRGACVRGTCACYEGYEGAQCERPVETPCLGNCSGRGECHKGWCLCEPPYWGSDCSRSRGEGPRCLRRPCIYVYELPPRMNVLALKAEYDWRAQYAGRKFDYRMPPTW